MPDDIRSGVLRQNRKPSEITGQDTRTAGGRTAHLSRGSVINYQKDLGFSAGEDVAQNARAQKAAYEAAIAEREAAIQGYETNVASQYAKGKGQLSAAQNKLNDARSKFGTYSTVVSNAWKQQKKGWVPVVLVDENNKPEGTYYLPKESAAELAKTKGLWTNWDPKGTQLFVSTKVEGGRYRGKELHEQLKGAEKSIYNKWYEQSSPELLKGFNTAKGELSNAKGVLSSAYGALENQYLQATTTASNARGAVSAAKEGNRLNWEQLKIDYEKKKKTIAEIFKNFSVKEGGK